MTEQEIYEKVVGLVKPFAKNEEGLKNISMDSKILDDLGVNSARLVDIILACEDEFGIEVDDESADKIRTVRDAMNLVKVKTNT